MTLLQSVFDSTIESESESEAEVDPVDEGGGDRATEEEGAPTTTFELLQLLLAFSNRLAGC